MGHRRSRSHTRASKRGSPEEVGTHSRVKYDTNEDHSKTSDKKRRHKRERKRKREEEYKESSRKKHREKHKEENYHHKSKEKSKAKVTRRKDGRSLTNETSESENSTSSRGAHYQRCTHKAYPSHEHGDNSNADIASRKHRSKRSRETNTAHSKDDVRETYEASKDAMHVEKHGVRGATNKLLVQVKDALEGAELKGRHLPKLQDRHDATISRIQEDDMGLGGRKDNFLEVELRQRALANFLRHQDPPCKTNECMERISPPVLEGATPSSFHNEQAVSEADIRTAPSNAVKVDTHTPMAACASNISAHVSHRDLRECTQPACNSSSNLEEGEIVSDNENVAESDHVHRVTDGAKALYDKDKTPTGAHRQADTGKTERPDPEIVDADATHVKERQRAVSPELVDNDATGLKERQEVSQEHAVNVSPAAAKHDVDDSFQQKTMSVMRGGEMVQVSYKVYIPKRAAELARRRLQR